jgi:hypothetical protein
MVENAFGLPFNEAVTRYCVAATGAITNLNRPLLSVFVLRGDLNLPSSGATSSRRVIVLPALLPPFSAPFRVIAVPRLMVRLAGLIVSLYAAEATAGAASMVDAATASTATVQRQSRRRELI